MILFPYSFGSSCRRLAISGQYADDAHDRLDAVASPGAQGFRPAITAAYSHNPLTKITSGYPAR
ncbi:MAG: hypothetical protein FWG50_07515 [Kiritimatiellaeota bacterium]|nr:hypothetical protein [Kiritimatiellota bacterium]